jgi:drug/metabolite transporter (DMT)-like permease
MSAPVTPPPAVPSAAAAAAASAPPAIAEAPAAVPRAPAAGPTVSGFTSTDLGLLLMAGIWGVNFTVVKAGIAVMPAEAFNGLRVLLAAVVLLAVAFVVAGRRQFPSRRDALALLAMGVLGNGVYQLMFIAGLSRTRAGIAALVIAAGPAWIALLSRLFGRERLPARGWLGIGLQMVGMLCVVASAGLLEADVRALTGAAFIMIGSIIWALFTVLLQPYTARVHPLHLAALTLASGALLLFLVGLPDIVRLDWAAVPLSAWGAVLYAGVGALVIAYLLFYRGVRVLGPTRTAMYGNLQPLIALLVAWLALHERPTRWQLLGGMLVMTGLLISRSSRPQPGPRAQGVRA